MIKVFVRAAVMLSVVFWGSRYPREHLIRKRIVIVSTDSIGYGGAAVNAQDLYEHLQEFYVTRFKVNLLYIKPTCHDTHNYNCIPFRSLPYIMPRDVFAVFAMNYAAPLIVRPIFPSSRLFFVAVGSEAAIRESEKSGSILASSPEKPCVDGDETIAGYRVSEAAAAQVASVVLAVSHEVEAYMQVCSPTTVSLFDIVGIRYARLMHLQSRSHPSCDVCFLVSNVNRRVKNALFVRRLLRQRRSARFCIAGRGAKAFFFNDVTRLDSLMELIDQSALINFIRNCKIVIVPSLWESSGNVVAETIAVGRLPLTSMTGYYTVLHSLSVVRGFDVSNWLRRINILLGLSLTLEAIVLSANTAAMNQRARVAKLQLDSVLSEN